MGHSRPLEPRWRLTAPWMPCAWTATVYAAWTLQRLRRRADWTHPLRSQPLRREWGSRSCRVIVSGQQFRRSRAVSRRQPNLTPRARPHTLRSEHSVRSRAFHRLAANSAYVDAKYGASGFCSRMSPGKSLSSQTIVSISWRSVEMLHGGRASITSVWARRGFASVASFGHAFRQVLGITPGEFEPRGRGRVSGWAAGQLSKCSLTLQISPSRDVVRLLAR
jgi:hypothetical protein